MDRSHPTLATKVVAHLRYSIVIASTACISLATAQSETISTEADQSAVAVTIYNNDLAFIKERREVAMVEGEQRLVFKGVSARIQPQTSVLSSHDDLPDIRLFEQSFDYDLLTPERLLQSYVGREIVVIHPHHQGQQEKREKATVLSINNGVILQFADRLESGAGYRYVYPELPAQLRTKPTLGMTIDNPRAGKRQIGLNYLTNGLSWSTDYVASLADDEKSLNINAWVTLVNDSGIDYPNSSLQLVAGDIRQVQQPAFFQKQHDQPVAMARGVIAEANVQEQGLLDFHLYSIPRPVTIKHNQQKQIALLNATDVALQKTYQVTGQPAMYALNDEPMDVPVAVKLVMQNQTESGLGRSLPAGVVRVYKNDAEGRAQFVGADRISHSAEGKTIKLNLGNAFDVTAQRVQDVFKESVNGNGVRDIAMTNRIILRNARAEAVSVDLHENFHGQWRLTDASLEPSKRAGNSIQWKVAIPPKGEVAVQYSVQLRR